jgi:hypothetical protein
MSGLYMSHAMEVMQTHSETNEECAMSNDYAHELAAAIDEEVERLCEEEDMPEDAARELAILMVGHHRQAAGM